MVVNEEDQVFRENLRQAGFRIVDMDPDGHCLFRAILMGLQLNGFTNYDSVYPIRNAIAVGMDTYQHYQYVQNYFHPNSKPRYDLPTEARLISDTGLWGNDLSVMIAALIWKINFVVITPPMQWYNFPEQPFRNGSTRVYLSFHNRNHYNFLEPEQPLRYRISLERLSTTCKNGDDTPPSDTKFASNKTSG